MAVTNTSILAESMLEADSSPMLTPTGHSRMPRRCCLRGGGGRPRAGHAGRMNHADTTGRNGNWPVSVDLQPLEWILLHHASGLPTWRRDDPPPREVPHESFAI